MNEPFLFLGFGDHFTVLIIHSILAMALALLAAKMATRNLQNVPKGCQNVMESVIDGILRVGSDVIPKEMAKKYPIVVGIDAIDGYVAVEGWGEVSSMKATDLAKEFALVGVEAIICTDISKDGMLCGVNVEWTQQIAQSSGIDTIASGGVKGIDDIIRCKENGNIAGVIVGKAFYEGKIDLQKAFQIL